MWGEALQEQQTQKGVQTELLPLPSLPRRVPEPGRASPMSLIPLLDGLLCLEQNHQNLRSKLMCEFTRIILIYCTSGSSLRTRSAALRFAGLLEPARQHVRHPLHERHVRTLLSCNHNKPGLHNQHYARLKPQILPPTESEALTSCSLQGGLLQNTRIK